MTREELAEAAKLSPRSVSDLERGVNRTAGKTSRCWSQARWAWPGPVHDCSGGPRPGPAKRGNQDEVAVNLNCIALAWH